MRLGERLVTKGLILEEQLRQALEAQLIYGGHLGTVLIELGHLTEPQLGMVLSETFGVDYATNEMLADIPRFVINSLPAKLVEKHTCVPFRLQDRLLHLAMVDPKNLLGLDELSFAAGHRIQPWVTPEVRLYQAMERYYDIPRRLRYVTLCKQMDSARRSGLREMQHARLAAVPATAPAAAPSDPVRPATETHAVAEAARPPPSSAVCEDALAVFSDTMCRADSQSALADAVLVWVAGHARHAVLFKVKNGTAFFWRATGFDVVASAARLSLDVCEEPLFRLLGGEGHYRGPVPAESAVWDGLGLARPAEALVLPVHLEDRLVALLYADGGEQSPLDGEMHDFVRVVRKLALGLKMMIVQRKLRSI